MTNEEIQNLIDQTDIVSLISKYISLNKKGKNYEACCPFHNEKTPSFVVSPEKKMFNCFGCHTGGNALDFIKKIEGIEFVDALKKLCEFNNVEFKGNNIKKENPNLKYYKIMDVSKSFYKTFLKNDVSGEEAINYLKSRGLNDELIDKFDIGLAPSFGDTLYQVLKSLNYLELDMTDMGLVENNSKGYYDIFSNRIMFPIKDDMGNTLAFSGRIYNIKDNSKYINSKETKMFRKNEVLFNINLAKPEIIKKHRLILHEGQMDVIAAYRSDLKEAVCSLGTGFTVNHIKLIKKYCNQVIVCYDGDNAGISSAIKAINLLRNAGIKTYAVLLPDRMDPDEYVLKYGPEKYKEYFEGHIIDSYEFEFEAQFINKNLNDYETLNEIRNNVFEIISKLNSQIEIDEYLNKFNKKINSNIDAVKYDYENYKNNHSVSNMNNTYIENYDYGYVDIPQEYYNNEPKPIINIKPYNNICEIKLFRYAMESKILALQIDEKIMNDIGAMTKENQALWSALIDDFYNNYDTFDQGVFIKMLNERDADTYLKINEELFSLKNELYNMNDLNDCINKLKSLNFDESNKNLKEVLQKEKDQNEAISIVAKMFSNKKKKDKFDNDKKDKKV